MALPGEAFRLRADAMRAMARRMNARFALMVGAVAVLVVGFFHAALRERDGGQSALALGLGLVAVLAWWSWRRRLGRFRARWATYTVVLGPDAVERTVEGYPDVRIARSEVGSIEEAPAGLVVRSRSGAVVVVPRETEGFERIRAALLGWRAG